MNTSPTIHTSLGNGLSPIVAFSTCITILAQTGLLVDQCGTFTDISDMGSYSPLVKQIQQVKQS